MTKVPYFADFYAHFYENRNWLKAENSIIRDPHSQSSMALKHKNDSHLRKKKVKQNEKKPSNVLRLRFDREKRALSVP